MNGKQKLLASALLGTVLALAIIAGSNVLPVVIPGITAPAGGPGDTSGTLSTLKTGTLVLNIKDAPPQTRNLTQLLIKLAPGSVILHRAAENGSENRIPYNMTSSAEEQFDLLQLVGDLKKEIGANKVPVGTYTMIEIHIASAKGVFDDSNETADLRVVAQGKLKIPVVFRVMENQTTEVTIDVTLESIRINPNDVLKPVIKPIVERQPEVESTETTTSTTESTTTTTTAPSGTSA